MDLSFLSNVVLNAEASAPRRLKKERVPETAHLRVFKNGAVYPSRALVEAFGLEYRPLVKNEKGEWEAPADPGNGFDVCLSTKFPAFGSPQPVVVISVVPRSEPKISLFGTVTYVKNAEELEEGYSEGDPLVSVTEQGSTTFGAEELLPMLAETYGVAPGKDGYIDLNFVGSNGQVGTDSPWVFDRPVFVPKKVSRGDMKGQTATQRRENGKYFALVPVMETTEPVGPTKTAEPATEKPAENQEVASTPLTEATA